LDVVACILFDCLFACLIVVDVVDLTDQSIQFVTKPNACQKNMELLLVGWGVSSQQNMIELLVFQIEKETVLYSVSTIHERH